MNPNARFNAVRRLPIFRGLMSKLGSLLLLFQRSPLIQMLFPEARLLAGAGLGEATKWTVTAIVGLGAFDTVAGATEISQVIPDSGSGEVTATTGEFLNFIVQVTGTPSTDQVSWSIDGLPPGLTHSELSTPSTHQISGIPTEAGETTVTVTAWEAANQTGSSFSKEFLFIVAPPPPPIIVNHPASVAIANNTQATLSVTGDPNGSTLTYRWHRGSSGDTSSPVTGAAGSGSSYTTPVLTTTTTPANYWVRVTRDGVSKDSNTATVTIATVPVITTHPLSPTVNSGETTTLTVDASGTSPTFQWYRGESGNTADPVPGATSASFTTPALTATMKYWVRATNVSGTADSDTAVVTIPGSVIAPAITTQPVSATIGSGATATLTVAASGTSPAFQWYLGSSGDVANPVEDATSATFTTPPLTDTTRYWARATNTAGISDSNAATVTVNPPVPDGAGPFKVGESVVIDLTPLYGLGETLKLVGKLPKGLKLNLKTRQITGIVTGLTGTYPIKFNLLQGKTLLRAVDFPIVIAGSAYFNGQYEALLESNAGIPAGAFKLLFKKANAWSATLESPGAKARKAAGKLTVLHGSSTAVVTAAFPASGSAPAVALNATLDLESPMVSGIYNGGTVRGFRLAQSSELPGTGTRVSLVFETPPNDGMTVPAGFGWANGSIGTSGSTTFNGMLGDGTAVNLPIHLSATGQAILWSQPYANTSSYFGGIVTLPDLGQTPAADPPLSEKVWWFKGPDTKSLSYPAGFPAMEVTVGSSTWTVPGTAAALGASLGWLNNSSPAVEIDGAGLSNAAPQLTSPTLPTGFTLDASFNLTVPATSSGVSWTGKTSAINGTFTGSFALPVAFVPAGIAGPAAASGVLLQAQQWDTVTGCGLIKVPVAGAKGSFRTAAIVIRQ